MQNEFEYAHLHGFASSKRSRKGLFLAKAFAARGLHLNLPDLNRPSFAQLTYTGALGAMDELDRERSERRTRWRISGSSMGGYLAARWAELHPDRVDRLVLLCPGFGLEGRWQVLIGREGMQAWEELGSREFLDGAGRPAQVSFDFIRDGSKHPAWPEVPCPTLILHGAQDQTVPIESSRFYASSRGNLVKLVELEDDHSLMNSLARIVAEIFRFYEE